MALHSPGPTRALGQATQTTPDAVHPVCFFICQCRTTVTMPLLRRLEPLARAERGNFAVIEEHDVSELNFSDQPTPALKRLANQARVVYLGSLSTRPALGLRWAAWWRLPRWYASCALRRPLMRHVATDIQQAAASFIGHGIQEAFARRLNVACRDRAPALRATLAQHAAGLLPLSTHGLQALRASADAGVDTRELTALAHEQRAASISRCSVAEIRPRKRTDFKHPDTGATSPGRPEVRPNCRSRQPGLFPG
jgi:DNA-binding transcriptional MocR family regulator